MHKKSINILRGLGFGPSVVSDLEQLSSTNSKKEILRLLKTLKLPIAAAKQIKKIEGFTPSSSISGATNSELLESLLKKCKRSFDAFAKKETSAQIVFVDNNWTLYSEEFDSNICKLHKVCKPHFDIWANEGLQTSIIFDGTSKWKTKTKNK
jgi:hypothetical protein